MLKLYLCIVSLHKKRLFYTFMISEFDRGRTIRWIWVVVLLPTVSGLSLRWQTKKYSFHSPNHIWICFLRLPLLLRDQLDKSPVCDIPISLKRKENRVIFLQQCHWIEILKGLWCKSLLQSHCYTVMINVLWLWSKSVTHNDTYTLENVYIRIVLYVQCAPLQIACQS